MSDDESTQATPAMRGALASGAAMLTRRGVSRSGVAILTVTAVASASFALHPHGLVTVFFALVFAGLCLAIAFGPIARRAHPRSVWLPVTGAGLSFLFALGAQYSPQRIGLVAVADIPYFVGYAFLVVWLFLLSRHVGGPERRGTYLDTAAATVGVALALWSVALGPLAGGSQLHVALGWAVYPTVDVVLLVLCVHLALRQGTVVPALRWLIATLFLEFGIHCVESVTHTLSPGASSVVPLALYLPIFSGFAVAATHPTVGALSTPPETRHTIAVPARRTIVIFLTMLPALAATAMPTHGRIDALVRTVLVGALLTLLFVRLSRTLTALAQAEAESRRRATRDPLTGLLNRAALHEALTDRVGRNAAFERSTAVLFLDCDDFKRVNDTWGHHAGDVLLRGLAERLSAMLDPGDLVARHGGDEFVVVSSVHDDDAALTLAERIGAIFAEPLPVAGDRLHAVTPSIGVAVVEPGAPFSADDALRMADSAMYEAKASGRGCHVLYDTHLLDGAHRRAVVGTKLGEAIRSHALTVHLQPIVGGPEYDRLLGWEALARWDDPHLGPVSPDVFVPMAAQLGHAAELTELVIDEALAAFVTRRASGSDALCIAVNLSRSQLRPGLVDTVRAAVRTHGVDPDCVWFEVGEAALVGEDPSVLAVLADLRALGTHLCIDDFGGRSTPLTTLLRLQVDCVKIGGIFVAALGETPDAPRRLGVVMDMLRGLGVMHVVAKGVESQAQADALRALGCPMAQGWYFDDAATDVPPAGDRAESHLPRT